MPAHSPQPRPLDAARAWAAVAIPLGDLPAARQRVAERYGETLSRVMVKHLDEQSVAGLLAVGAAVDRAGAAPGAWRDWGVVAAPQRPGRLALGANLRLYPADGPRCISPYIVPHCSLHSLAGLATQVLGAHGPNLGVGGTPGDEGDALLAAATLIAEGVPGVWVVWTGWDAEPTVERPDADAVCRGAALALEAAGRVSPALDELFGTARPTLRLLSDWLGGPVMAPPARRASA